MQRLKDERRYRVFIDLERDASRFPTALWRPGGGETPREVTIWCSNDYLGMGGHPDVRGAATAAANQHGAGAGGTRNISGTHHRIVELEAELADLHGKEAGARFHLGLDLEPRGHLDHRLADAELPDPLGRAQPQFDDRGRPPGRMREAGLAAQ